jgi:hypothetical protein
VAFSYHVLDVFLGRCCPLSDVLSHGDLLSIYVGSVEEEEIQMVGNRVHWIYPCWHKKQQAKVDINSNI